MGKNMQVKEISVEIGRTSSVNYQSARNSVGLTAELSENDSVIEAVRALQRQAVDLLLGDNADLQDEIPMTTDIDVAGLDAALHAGAKDRDH